MERSRRGKLGTPNKRLKLPKQKVHTETLALGYYLTYFRHADDHTSVWIARIRHQGTGKQATCKLGQTDDRQEADGVEFLDYDQACRAVTAWCKSEDRRANLFVLGDAVPVSKKVTVRDCVQAYLAKSSRTRHNQDNVDHDKDRAEFGILPRLGNIPVSKLSKTAIETWMDERVAVGKRIRQSKKALEVNGVLYRPPASPEEIRKRRSSINREFTVLRSALNAAVKDGLIPDDHTPWRSVGLYADSVGVRLRFLTLDEQHRLLDACPNQEFRDLVCAALETGARYNELARATCGDFDASTGQLLIRFGKGKKHYRTRWVALGRSGMALFERLVEGRADTDPLLPHTCNRLSRKGLNRWAKNDAHEPMRIAVEAAGIPRVTFHELRHTYASQLIRMNVHLSIVAAQLGHSDTKMVEKHYGHLCPREVNRVIRATMPDLDVNPITGGGKGLERAVNSGLL